MDRVNAAFILSIEATFWLFYTLVVYQTCVSLAQRFKTPLIFHPVTVSLCIILFTVYFSPSSYADYMSGGQYISFLLGPATVALAVPLFEHRERIRRNWLALLLACSAGGLVAAVSAISLGLLLGLDSKTLLTLAPKSVTTPIAIGVAETLGGYASLASGIVLITGAIGCILAPPLFRLFNIEEETAQGLALGVGAHGFGTAYAFSYSNVAGAFAGLAMGLCGLLTAFFLPSLLNLMGLNASG